MLGTWMLCGNGWSLIWTLYDIIMVGTWMHCQSTETANDSAKVQKQQQKTTNNPYKCSQNGPSSIKPANKQQILEFWTRKEQNRSAGNISKKARTKHKTKERMFKNPSKTHAANQNFATATTKSVRAACQPPGKNNKKKDKKKNNKNKKLITNNNNKNTKDNNKKTPPPPTAPPPPTPPPPTPPPPTTTTAKQQQQQQQQQ